MMRNKLVFRKDIKIDTNRFARLCVNAGQKIEQHGKDGTKVDVLEAVYLRELEDLEEFYINEGMFFEWILDGSTYIGILALQDESIIETPEILKSFKVYDPDVKKTNLEDVKEEHLKRMKQGKKVDVTMEVKE